MRRVIFGRTDREDDHGEIKETEEEIEGQAVESKAGRPSAQEKEKGNEEGGAQKNGPQDREEGCGQKTRRAQEASAAEACAQAGSACSRAAGITIWRHVRRPVWRTIE